MLLIKKPDNVSGVIMGLLRSFGHQIDPERINDEIRKHPDTSSLLAISEILNWFRIDTAAFPVPAEHLSEIPVPFIIHTKRDNEFVIVHEVGAEKVTLSDHLHDRYDSSMEDLKNIYNGVVLAAEPVEGNSLPSGRRTSDMRFTVPAFIVLVFCLATLSYNLVDMSGLSGPREIVIFALKTLGILVSLLLIRHSIDNSDRFVQILCGGNGKTNCNAVLNSSAANVFPGLSWSEVGAFYFSGTVLVLSFSNGHLALLQLLAFLSACCLPYAFYSIYFQAKIAKQWCMLCMAIQILIWSEFAFLCPYLSFPIQHWSSTEFALSLLIFIPACLWFLMRPVVYLSKKANYFKGQLKKFKYNKLFFNSALLAQEEYRLPDNDLLVNTGEASASIVLTVVSSPTCGPCAKTHEMINEWLRSRPDIRLQTLFLTSGSANDPGALVASHILALAVENPVLLEQAMHSWYTTPGQDLRDWMSKFPVKDITFLADKLLRTDVWCEAAGIYSTPTILLNGRKLPDLYQLEDIRYLI